ncbi:hypothetical protein [Xanthobacter aminoxidans]|uniref:hypothetical protein n=1 Tax=Xanthobacter aminoxidans TaxID=186280 RepID=UPI002022E6D8|nr:hypothetical protein [Xanthobacter aminoxidans]MCL8385300.1 hypothetical protein [Xanthobacter aminoxidans]
MVKETTGTGADPNAVSSPEQAVDPHGERRVQRYADKLLSQLAKLERAMGIEPTTYSLGIWRKPLN